MSSASATISGVRGLPRNCEIDEIDDSRCEKFPEKSALPASAGGAGREGCRRSRRPGKAASPMRESGVMRELGESMRRGFSGMRGPAGCAPMGCGERTETFTMGIIRGRKQRHRSNRTGFPPYFRGFGNRPRCYSFGSEPGGVRPRGTSPEYSPLAGLFFVETT